MSDLRRRVSLFAKRFNVEKYLKANSKTFEEVESPNGKQLKVETCPFCNNVNHKGNIHADRLYIRSDDKRFLCYNCSEKGNIVRLLAGFENISEKSIVDKYIFGDYVELLPEELKVLILESGKEESGENTLPPVSLPSSFQPISLTSQTLNPEHQYLNSRGLFREDIVSKFDLRFCKYDVLEWGEDKRVVVRDRIIFPIIFDGEIRGWQGRDITNQQQPPYLINKGFQKQSLLFNYDNIKDQSHITITEGPIDAMKSIYINGTCLFGKYLSDIQERLLLKMKNLRTVYLCLDNDDPTALESQEFIAKRLTGFFEVYIISLPEGTDAGDMTPEAMIYYRDQAQRYNSDRIVSALK